MKLKTKKDIQDTTPVQNLVDVGRREGVCVGRAFSVTFCVLFFCILAHAYRSHQKTDYDRLWLKTRVSA